MSRENHVYTGLMYEPELAEIDRMNIYEIRATLNLCMARITQAVRHNKTIVPDSVYEDFVRPIPYLMYRFKALTGKEYIIEQLDHTDY